MKVRLFVILALMLPLVACQQGRPEELAEETKAIWLEWHLVSRAVYSPYCGEGETVVAHNVLTLEDGIAVGLETEPQPTFVEGELVYIYYPETPEEYDIPWSVVIQKENGEFYWFEESCMFNPSREFGEGVVAIVDGKEPITLNVLGEKVEMTAEGKVAFCGGLLSLDSDSWTCRLQQEGWYLTLIVVEMWNDETLGYHGAQVRWWWQPPTHWPDEN